MKQLPNGAWELERYSPPMQVDVILAAKPHQLPTGIVTEYVTWRVDAQDNCYYGNYFLSLHLALADFSARCGEAV